MIAVDVTVNGRRHREEVDPRLLLSDFLRHRLGLTGTHVGCEHGVCGACTVQLDGVAVRSCLLLAAQVDGSEVVTVEGLAGTGRADAAAGGVPPAPRAPVRLLHARDPHRRRRPALARAPADARGDRRHALRPPLSLHGLQADRRRDRGGRRRVNLALSLLYAAERTPDAEALVGERERLTYAELRERAARIAGGLAARGVGAGDRVAAVLANEPETVELYWALPVARRVRSSRSRSGSPRPTSTTASTTAARRSSCGEASEVRELVAAERAPRRARPPRTTRASMLYTSGTTGRPKGVPRSHRADRAGGLSQVVHHGLSLRRPHARRACRSTTRWASTRCSRCILVGGCFVCAAGRGTPTRRSR